MSSVELYSFSSRLSTLFCKMCGMCETFRHRNLVDTLPFSGIYSVLLTSFSVFCNCFPNLVDARLIKGFEPIRNGEIFCMDDKYHKEIWTNTLEVSLGWSLSLSIFGHFRDILSSISLYGTNFFKFHLFPSNKKIKQVKQSTNDWYNYNKNHII